MSRHGSRWDDRRRSVDVAVEERERDTYIGGSRERHFDFDENFEVYRDQRTAGALVPIHQERFIERDVVEIPAPVREERFLEVERIEREPIIEVELEKIEKKITEHEHEHHHRHIVIDHGTTYINAAPPPPAVPAPPPPLKGRTEVREKEITRVTLEGVRERRYGDTYRSSGDIEVIDKKEEDITIRERPRSRQRSTSRHVEYRRYRNYDDGYTYGNARDSSNKLGFNGEWTVVDVPGDARRSEREIDVTIKSENIRGGTRTGRSNRRDDLWTEITKDLVCREALDKCGYAYEERDDYFYVYEYLHQDAIHDVIELSKQYRREKVRDIEARSVREDIREATVRSIAEARSRADFEARSVREVDARSRARSLGRNFEADRVSERREYTPYGERDTYHERRDIYYA